MNRCDLDRIVPLLALLAVCPPAGAATWKKEPQPLLAAYSRQGARFPVTVTPGSSLAFDSAWKVLWCVSADRLTGYLWNRDKFFQPLQPLPQSPDLSRVAEGSAIVVDASWHLTYFVSPDQKLRVMQKSPVGWLVTDTIGTPVTQVLGVHPDWHTVFAYDAGSRSLLAVYWSAAGAAWKSSVIATDLGDMPAEGVVDAKRNVLYATAQDAPAMGVPGQPGVLQPWPLVATWWNGVTWKSQVITQTGVPQRPAHEVDEDRVYYTHRADLDSLHWFRPSQGKLMPGEKKSIPDLLTRGTFNGSTAPAFGERLRWQGTDSWVDDQRYRVNLTPQYSTGSSGAVLNGSIIKTGSGGITVSAGTLTLGGSSTVTGGGGSLYTGNLVLSGTNYQSSGNEPVWDSANGILTISGTEATIQRWAPLTEASVPYRLAASHVPVWETPESAAAGLREFRSLYSPKRGEIVQQRISEDPWTLTKANSWQYVSGVYQVGSGGYYRLGPGIVTTVRKHYEERVTTVPYADWSAANGPLPTSSTATYSNVVNSGSYGSALRIAPATMYGIQDGGRIGFANVGSAVGGTVGSAATYNGGIVKTGTGTLTLNGTNSYTPATTVTAGTLVLTNPGIADNTDLSLNTGGFLQLEFAGADTVNRLNFDGIQQAAGTWGSPTSGAEHTSALITGAGLLNVVTGPPPGLQTVTVHEWVETPNPDVPPVVTVDGVNYYDPTHPQTVTTVSWSMVKPIDELLGKGAIDSDPASQSGNLTDYQYGGARVRTFGHRTSDMTPKTPAPGGRYLDYPRDTNNAAIAGGIACDANSSMVFYVQAQGSPGGPAWVVVVD